MQGLCSIRSSVLHFPEPLYNNWNQAMEGSLSPCLIFPMKNGSLLFFTNILLIVLAKYKHFWRHTHNTLTFADASLWNWLTFFPWELFPGDGWKTGLQGKGREGRCMLKEEGESPWSSLLDASVFPKLTLLTEECQEHSWWTGVRSLKTTGAPFQTEMKEYQCPFYQCISPPGPLRINFMVCFISPLHLLETNRGLIRNVTASKGIKTCFLFGFACWLKFLKEELSCLIDLMSPPKLAAFFGDTCKFISISVSLQTSLSK